MNLKISDLTLRLMNFKQPSASYAWIILKMMKLFVESLFVGTSSMINVSKNGSREIWLRMSKDVLNAIAH